MHTRFTLSYKLWIAVAAAGVLITAAIALPLPLPLLHTSSTPTPVLAPSPNAVRAGPYLVDAKISPNPPQPGKNILTLALRDAAGQPVAGAHLNAEAVMPSMGAMPAMHAPADIVETTPGDYRGEFELPMEGPWPLTLTISGPAGPGRLTLDMSTERPGLHAENAAAAPARSESSELETGTITLDAHRRQRIGVITANVERRAINYTIRAAGRVSIDERRLSDVALKFDGWIGELHANYIGAQVHKGEPLFTVYSPLLFNAQRELLFAAQQQDKSLLRAARERLSLWDMTREQIAALEQRGEALRYVPIFAPVDGVVTEKNVVAGSAFRAAERLLRIADLSRVWVEAQVYANELPLLHAGDSVEVRLPDVPQRTWRGRVSYIAPALDTDTRTARVRVELDNADGFLRADLYVEMRIASPLGERLVVPEDAVLFSGANRVVFVDLGAGRLQPRRVKTGVTTGGWAEILDGVREGEVIVTSGNFLIASESKLKAGVEQW